MTKLADHRNDLFATRDSVAAALESAYFYIATAPEHATMIKTVVHIVLNSAIAMHQQEVSQIVQRHAELAQERTDPLTEQIRNIVREMTKGELLGDTIATIVKAEVDAVIGDKTQECIEEWVSGNLDSKIEEWSEQNLDLSDAVKTYIDDEIDWEDMISEKIHAYFSNNSFSIEAR